MDILFTGGLWTVFLIFGLMAGYNWALNGPRWVYRTSLGVAVVAVIISQLLPQSHMFRQRVAEGLHWWLWAAAIAAPILAYALLLRWIKRKADARNDT